MEAPKPTCLPGPFFKVQAGISEGCCQLPMATQNEGKQSSSLIKVTVSPWWPKPTRMCSSCSYGWSLCVTPATDDGRATASSQSMLNVWTTIPSLPESNKNWCRHYWKGNSYFLFHSIYINQRLQSSLSMLLLNTDCPGILKTIVTICFQEQYLYE